MTKELIYPTFEECKNCDKHWFNCVGIEMCDKDWDCLKDKDMTLTKEAQEMIKQVESWEGKPIPF